MQDFEAFQGALEQEQEHDGEAYMSTLVSSMCLVLEEFYSTLRVIWSTSVVFVWGTFPQVGLFFSLLPQQAHGGILRLR